MRTLPITSELLAISKRVIWFEEPEQALSDPVRFIAYAMTYARHEDMQVIRQHLTDEDLLEALEQAAPGIIDARSWSYWHLKLGIYPAPEMPLRKL